MRVHFRGQAFDYQTLRALAYTTFGGAEPGEVLVTAERIKPRSTESWYQEWSDTASRVEDAANEALDRGRTRTARYGYFRAHTYYRTAEFFLPPDDERRIPTYERSRESFRIATELLSTPVEILSIPFDDTELPGYLFLPDNAAEASEPLPVIICLGGFDSLGEELYFICGVPEALARGYAVVLFDGPGQGAPLRYEEMTARRDWENVVQPAIDVLEGRDELDTNGVGLIGVSMGGYYAPRAAAFEKRIGACCVFDHQHDVLLSAADGDPRMARIAQRIPDLILEPLVSAGGRVSVEARWLIQQGKWVFGVDSVGELIDAFGEYSVTDVAGHIECPMLILAGENDHFVPVEMAEQFESLLTSPTTLRVFTEEEGAAEHCQMGNLRLATAEIYDWFDEALA